MPCSNTSPTMPCCAGSVSCQPKSRTIAAVCDLQLTFPCSAYSLSYRDGANNPRWFENRPCVYFGVPLYASVFRVLVMILSSSNPVLGGLYYYYDGKLYFVSPTKRRLRRRSLRPPRRRPRGCKLFPPAPPVSASRCYIRVAPPRLVAAAGRRRRVCRRGHSERAPILFIAEMARGVNHRINFYWCGHLCVKSGTEGRSAEREAGSRAEPLSPGLTFLTLQLWRGMYMRSALHTLPNRLGGASLVTNVFRSTPTRGTVKVTIRRLTVSSWLPERGSCAEQDIRR